MHNPDYSAIMVNMRNFNATKFTPYTRTCGMRNMPVPETTVKFFDSNS